VIEKVPNPVAEREAHAYVTNVYVEPALRGHGTGGRLLEAAIAWCQVNEIDAVILWPTPESRSLYERHGFAVSDDLLQLRLGPTGFKS
jgi:GNAT superfamily N-acetyltransferase